MEKTKKKNIIFIIIALLAVLLVVVGLVIATTTKKEKDTSKDKEVKDNRCVDKVCISKVSVEEVADSKSINVVLKNESNVVIENLCVNLIAEEQKYVICLNDAAANEELQLNLEYTETAGTKIEDYSLEKASDEETKEANRKRQEVLEQVK